MVLKLSGLALAGLIGSASLACAASTFETETSGPPQANLNQAVTFSGFDTALGTLNDITISATETIGGTLQVYNLANAANSPVTYTSQAWNSWEVILPGPNGIGSAVDPTTGVLEPVTDLSSTTSSNIITDTLAAGDTAPTHSLSGTSNASVTSVAKDDLSAYEAGFLVGFQVYAFDYDTNLVQATNGPGEADVEATGQISVTVTYDYTPIAEPISLTLFGVGMLGTAAVRRRRS